MLDTVRLVALGSTNLKLCWCVRVGGSQQEPFNTEAPVIRDGCAEPSHRRLTCKRSPGFFFLSSEFALCLFIIFETAGYVRNKPTDIFSNSACCGCVRLLPEQRNGIGSYENGGRGLASVYHASFLLSDFLIDFIQTSRFAFFFFLSSRDGLGLGGIRTTLPCPNRRQPFFRVTPQIFDLFGDACRF